MSVSRQRPLRTYDAQTILDATDVHGLKKALDAQIDQCGEDGLVDTIYYEGMLDAVDILTSSDVERWPDFMEMALMRLEDRKGEKWA